MNFSTHTVTAMQSKNSTIGQNS